MKIRFPDWLTNRFVPRLDAVDQLEYFLISAVSSLLIIRLFLTITGFPQLGGGSFHIAHMLWGGLLMTISIFMTISFLNNYSRIFAVVVGGVGFGMFIDELGKFITADNNYFYQPTVAIIYISFILIFLMIKSLSSITQYSNKTYTANSLEALKEVVINDLDYKEKINALKYLELTGRSTALQRMLYEVIEKSTFKEDEPSIIKKLNNKIIQWYKSTLGIKIVYRLLLIAYMLSTILLVILSFIDIKFGYPLTFTDWGLILSICLSAVFVAIALVNRFRKNNLGFYTNLEKATLVSIFISQFFFFLEDQFHAVIWLLLYISIFIIIKFAIDVESSKVKTS